MRSKCILLFLFFLAALPVKVFSAISTKAGSVGHGKSGKSEGFSLTVTGSMRTDMIGGQNDFRDTILFNKGNAVGDPNSIAQIVTCPGTTYPSKHADLIFNVNNSRLWFLAEHDQGSWHYEFNLIFTGDLSSRQALREAYMGLSHPQIGTFAFGDTKGIEQRVTCGPSDFICATGGTDGNFIRFLNQTTYVFMGPSLVGDTGVATKAVWCSPRFLHGFQIGVAYTPNTQHLGESFLNTATSPLEKPLQVFDEKSLVVGVNYLAKGENGSIELAFVKISGDTKPEIPNKPLLLRNNTNSYDYGFVLKTGPWSLGAELFLNNRSGTLSNSISSITPTIDGQTLLKKFYDPSLAGKYWGLNCGLGFSAGPTSLGFSYFYTKRNTGIVTPGEPGTSAAVGQSMVLSAEYQLAAGLASYIEGAIYRMRNPDWAYIGAAFSGLTGFAWPAVPSNTAKMVLSGFKIQF